jgi:hypothetical protein
MKRVATEVEGILKGIIAARENAMSTGAATTSSA